MRLCHLCLATLALAPACAEPATDLDVITPALTAAPRLVAPFATTPSLHEYEDAPRAPNADDPAIWAPRRGRHAPLVITVLKGGGLEVYDLDGHVVQSLAGVRRPPLAAEDPASPGPQPDPGTGACAGSESGEIFSRYNNVAIAYDVPLRRPGGRVRRVDLAVVSDRGCDRLRFFAIDPDAPGGPLVDVTAAAAPRVFPTRFVQPSPAQSPGEPSRLEANPIDDQSTAYGVAVYRRGAHGVRIAVTQRSRAVIALVELVATADGRVTYQRRAELRADPIVRIRAPGGGWMGWTPCREDAVDDPQFEGLVYDDARRILWASQEVVGLWAIPLDVEPWGVVELDPHHLVEPVRSFGAPYWAVPDDGEFACEDEAPWPIPAGTVVVRGNPGVGGRHLEADVEGLALVRDPDDGEPERLLVSSQGDDTIHVYELDRRGLGRHRGAFQVDGVTGTDGLDVVTTPLGAALPDGLLVVHNGGAPPPASSDPVNGFPYAESTQFALVDWGALDDL